MQAQGRLKCALSRLTANFTCGMVSDLVILRVESKRSNDTKYAETRPTVVKLDEVSLAITTPDYAVELIVWRIHKMKLIYYTAPKSRKLPCCPPLKNVQFPGHNHRCRWSFTSTIAWAPASHQHQWLAGGYDLENKTCLELDGGLFAQWLELRVWWNSPLCTNFCGTHEVIP